MKALELFRIVLVGSSLLSPGLPVPSLAAAVPHPGPGSPVPEVLLELPVPAGTLTASPEGEWMPQPQLRYDQDGSRVSAPDPDAPGAPSRGAHGAGGDFPKGTVPVIESAGHGLTPTVQGLTRGLLMDPLDLLFRGQTVQASCGKGFSDLSVVTPLPEWTDRLGVPIAAHSVLSINVDMLGFEDAGGVLPGLLDPRHPTPKWSDLSPSLGITLKF